MKKIPVNIISGFLGSGKTTSIIKLLDNKANDEQWAVIINEFGKIAIDSQTLSSSSDAGTVFDISGGCICCSAKGYFRENLEQIVKSGNYSRIIIEPSGLGGIEMVSEIVAANPNLCLMPTICLVDTMGIENPRLQLNPIYQMQIRKADVIVFSKLDLVKDETEQNRLIDKIKKLYPDKVYSLGITASDLLFLLPAVDPSFDHKENKFGMVSPVNQYLTDRNYQEKSYTFEPDIVFDIDQLFKFLTTQPSIVRAKGFIHTKTGWMLFNYTLTGFQTEPCQEKESNLLVAISTK